MPGSRHQHDRPATSPPQHASSSARPSSGGAPAPAVTAASGRGLSPPGAPAAAARARGSGSASRPSCSTRRSPGIGKSTLALQACGALARQGLPVLYVAGEESPEQVRLRADRLGMAEAGVLVVAETAAESVAELIGETHPAAVRRRLDPDAHTRALGSAPAAWDQVRESAALLVARAKASGVACFLIGHVTKEGTLAGRACSSTWSTPCSTSRATARTPCACCAPSRTASARPTRWRCSRWGGRARGGPEPLGRLPRRTAGRRAGLGRAGHARGQPPPAGRDPGARLALGLACRAGPPSASTPAAWRSSSPCSRSAWGSRSRPGPCS